MKKSALLVVVGLFSCVDSSCARTVASIKAGLKKSTLGIVKRLQIAKENGTVKSDDRKTIGQLPGGTRVKLGKQIKKDFSSQQRLADQKAVQDTIEHNNVVEALKTKNLKRLEKAKKQTKRRCAVKSSQERQAIIAANTDNGTAV